LGTIQYTYPKHKLQIPTFPIC